MNSDRYLIFLSFSLLRLRVQSGLCFVILLLSEASPIDCITVVYGDKQHRRQPMALSLCGVGGFVAEEKYVKNK